MDVRQLMNLGLIWKGSEHSKGIIGYKLSETYIMQQKLFLLDIETHNDETVHIQMTPKKLEKLRDLLNKAHVERELREIGRVTR